MNWKALIIWMIILVCAPCIALAQKQGNNLPLSKHVGVVDACGIALNIGDRDIVYKQALDDAKKKAVKKAVARFLAPDERPDSIYMQTVKTYKNFVVGEPEIFKKDAAQGKQKLFCHVRIDFSRIGDFLQSMRSKEQDKQDEFAEETCFLIRVTGLEKTSPRLQMQLPADALKVFARCFSEQGLKAANVDMTQKAIEQFNNLQSSNAFAIEVQKQISQSPDISIAAIGEIRLQSSTVDQSGALAEATASITLVHNSSDINSANSQVLCTYENKFYTRRATKDDADSLVILKASMEASKYLADAVLKYWREHPQGI